MSSRFSRQDSAARNDLFSTYNRSASPSKNKNKTQNRSSPYNASYGYTPPPPPSSSSTSNGGLFPPTTSSGTGTGTGRGSGGGDVGSRAGSGSAWGTGGGSGYGNGVGHTEATFRSATPNSRGQYSAAVLDELESQSDEQMGVLTSKVKMLKDLTHLIGDEIRDSTALAESMNDQFENSRNKIRGTMTRMLRMAKKTGVGWRVWVGFFAVVVLLFWWVWLG